MLNSRPILFQIYFIVLISLFAVCCAHPDLNSCRSPASAGGSCRGVYSSSTADQLLEQNRWQEAAWLLKRTGQQMQFSELEKKITDLLTNGKIKNISRYQKANEDNLSEVYLVSFSNGAQAIFKPHSKYWTEKKSDKFSESLTNPNSEVMTYLFNKELELGIVPVTIKRQILQMEGSLQIFVKLETDLFLERLTVEQKVRVTEIIEKPYTKDELTLNILDYLTFNTDRSHYYDKEFISPLRTRINKGNRWHNRSRWLADDTLKLQGQPGEESGLVAYDNGAGFQLRSKAVGNSFPDQIDGPIGNRFKEQLPFYENLKNKLTAEKIRKMMHEAFSGEIIDDVLQRRKDILKFFEDKLTAK